MACVCVPGVCGGGGGSYTQAVWQYQSLHGHLPPVGDTAAAEEVVRLARDVNDTFKLIQTLCGPDSAMAMPEDSEVPEDIALVVLKYALYAAAEIQVCDGCVGCGRFGQQPPPPTTHTQPSKFNPPHSAPLTRLYPST